jgi:hypothetical protein
MSKTIFEAKTLYGDDIIFFLEDILYVKFANQAPTHPAQMVVRLTSSKVLNLDRKDEDSLRAALQQSK